MITLGYSLLHLLDTESARRGLTRADMIECIKLAITENFKRRGRIVDVTVDDHEGEAVISAQETILTGGPTAIYREVRFIPPFTPELLTECIDEYVTKKQAGHKWSLTETKVIGAGDDYYLLEVVTARGASSSLDGKIAVLPKRSVSEDDELRIGSVVWSLVKAYERTRMDSGYSEPWRDIDVPLLASRTESEFLALMAYQMLGEPVTAVIHSSRGILIFPPGEDLQPLLANDGKHKAIMQKLAGLKRLAVARRSEHPDLDKKLIHAIKEIAGLKYGSDFKIGAADPTQLPKIYVKNEKAPRLVGTNGHNLYFIKCTVGFQFEIKVSNRVGPRVGK